MTEIEKAIKFFEEELKNGKCIEDCPQYNANEVALKVLKEKAEREKGCELCNNKGMKQYAISLGHQYCPGCGRKLVSEESHDS